MVPPLGHLCPCSDMANGEVSLDPVHPSRMAKLPTRFHHGVPTSACRNATLHAVATGLQVQRDDEKNAYCQVDMQCVWPETGWPRMEQIHGPRHVRNWLHTEQI